MLAALDLDSPDFGSRGEHALDVPGFHLDTLPLGSLQLVEEGRAPTAVAKLASLLSRTSLLGQA